MDLHRSADKLQTDARHLVNLTSEPPEGERLELALSVARRVRRTSTLIVKRLASERDNPTQPKEADTE